MYFLNNAYLDIQPIHKFWETPSKKSHATFSYQVYIKDNKN